jgi:hypothetical protein
MKTPVRTCLFNVLLLSAIAAIDSEPSYKPYSFGTVDTSREANGSTIWPIVAAPSMALSRSCAPGASNPTRFTRPHGVAPNSPVPSVADTKKKQHLANADEVPKGLSNSDWQSIRAAYEAGQYAVQRVGGGWQARNPGQQWTTKFDRHGFVTEPKGGGWQWGLELKSYGFSGQERSVRGVPGVAAGGQRLSYQWDAAVQEWWVNDGRGLEHGFTVTERPAHDCSLGSEPSTLNFLLAVRGTLRPQLAEDAHEVQFQDGQGATVLTYSGLKVWDADGKILPARFAKAEADVRLVVDEHGARYPLTIDPVAQQAYLKPAAIGTTQANDFFGFSVAVSGDTVVVGAMQEDSSTTGVNSTPNEDASDSGAAYVFVRNAGGWTQQAYLKPTAIGSTQAGDLFGYGVALSGDTVVIGAALEDSSTTGVNSTPNESASGSGAAYVFVRSAGTWTQQAYLKPAAVGTTQANDFFGFSVDVSGDTLVVGAAVEDGSTTGVNSTPDEGASDSGAVYVFVRSAGVWTQQAYLKPAAVGITQAGDEFGGSVAISGDTMVVGAALEDSSTMGVNSTATESASESGAVYVFVRSAGVWTQQAYLKPAAVGTTQAEDNFGSSVDLFGDTVVVGAIQEDSGTIGVNSTPNENATNSGAAYVFVRSAGTWTQQAYLKPAAVGVRQTGDNFGWSVAVSDETVVVGAIYEDSDTMGVNSTPNENAADSGAAYVFARSAGDWTQQAYLKPTALGATQVGDQLGRSVAVWGDTVVVGAIYEDSGTTLGNSAPNENASDSGVAYVFLTRVTPTITTQASAATTIGGPVSDSATLAGASNPTGSITFKLHGPDDAACGGAAVFTSAAVTVNGNGNYNSGNFTPSAPGTYRWIASYSGDPNNNAVSGACNDANESVAITPGPPVITSPLVATGTVGLPFTYQVRASRATSLGAGNLAPGLTFSTTLGAITGLPTAAGTYQVGLSATNSDGTTNATLTITVQPVPASGPIITSSTSATGRPGQAFNFQVYTRGGTPAARVSASSLPPGLQVDEVTGLISGTPTAEGSFVVTLTVTDGNLNTSSTLQLTFTSDPAVPVIVSPNTASLTPGQSFSYTINAPTTSDPVTDPTIYTLMGTLPQGLTFDSKTGTISGVFTGSPFRDGPRPDWENLSGGIVTNVQLFATNSSGTSTIPLLFTLAPSGAVNISTRIAVGSADNVLIGGFIITGNAAKQVIIRAIAPSLKVNGAALPGALQNPVLELYDNNGLLGSNDDWRESQENEIIATGIPPADEHESAIIATIIPGNYTAILRGQDNTTGIAVVEVYDLGTAGFDSANKATLAQISTRGTVQSDDNVMIGGFIISGVPTRVLVRAIGPELNGIVPGALQDTTLELRDSSGSLINFNDDWRTTQEQAIKDTTVPPTDNRESAIVATLNPGAYTAIVRGKDNTTGVALVEIYGLQ